MKNIEIKAMNIVLLIENGTIRPDQDINTFIGWQKMGYKIKKGAEHVAEFPIWVKNPKKEETQEEETEEQKKETPKKKHRDFILQTAYWFTNDHVEPIKGDA